MKAATTTTTKPTPSTNPISLLPPGTMTTWTGGGNNTHYHD
jgi:hypothetical protein